MYPTTESDDNAVYWRRRAVVLGGMLAVVGLLAWACGGDGERADMVGAMATPSPSLGGITAGIPPIPTHTPTPGPTATGSAKAARSGGARQRGVCAPRDVVVTLSMDGEVYPAGRKPRFHLSVVNTGRRTCAFDVGPAALRLQITSGRDRIWSSAHCAGSDGTSRQRLRRGVPYLRTIVWDRRRSAEGCPRERAAARPGTYVAKVKGKGVIRDGTQVFRLR
ncbi:hypothetical protein [Thermomonospora curvata]|uniref:Intracellular proteinase inhibitor BsuPI domain-containing protein n=1 Tax=Thermomonospora curvata (strain ATCC 19995 / DSM 43183 / JCM 3096 / KCTC 9072 / NBRC 15933 / NCIMB 10081 / Henssen B9) TaxID=471852 RepID=D1A4C3_THECD|nr:hypothetical protein [Thermomonospora curvata]ACY99997.1 hypothetical protein Tcur_4470 [Thermomonospora curvata DSM 43183]PKK12217.1 MAG: hypothetical protein BUE48_022000 [Thermomonospora sp. CIF 1]